MRLPCITSAQKQSGPKKVQFRPRFLLEKRVSVKKSDTIGVDVIPLCPVGLEKSVSQEGSSPSRVRLSVFLAAACFSFSRANYGLIIFVPPFLYRHCVVVVRQSGNSF